MWQLKELFELINPQTSGGKGDGCHYHLRFDFGNF